MVWFPVGKMELVSVAMPLESVAVPITFEPSRKVTVPVGRAVPVAPFTEAVRVSGAPLATVLDDAVSAVVVLTMSELTLM